MSDFSDQFDILPCIVCSKVLEPAFPSEVDSHGPYAATMFTSRGNYGSTLFDPVTINLFLQINVCDDCLRSAGERNHVFVGTQHRTVTPSIFGFWDENYEENQ